MVQAIYPKGVVPWVPRKDLVNVVYAADPNTIAAEVGAIETTLGTNPQKETAPPVGSTVVYSTVSGRIHAAVVGSLLPVCTLSNNSFTVSNSAATGSFNTYNVLDDGFGYYNGSDITAQADGWYILSAEERVDWWSSGYMHVTLYIGNTWISDDHWSWDFPENGHGGRWNGRNHVMSTVWQGVVHKGQRIRVKTENGTGRANIGVSDAFLRASFIRQVSANQAG